MPSGRLRRGRCPFGLWTGNELWSRLRPRGDLDVAIGRDCRGDLRRGARRRLPRARQGAADGATPPSYADLRVDTEVLETEHGAAQTKWYFSIKDQGLLGFETTVVKDEDPCEIYFSDYRKTDGRDLPYRIEVRYGNGRFGVFTVKSYQLASAGK